MRIASALGMVVLAACGGPVAGPDGGTGDASAGDAARWPTPPAPPVLTPCPPGWGEVALPEAPTVCEPWPGGRRTDCAPDEAHFPGTPGCARIGTACPASGWPEDLPVDRAVVYVDDDAPPGGDGSSPAQALSSIADATIIAPEGGIIALATGRWDEAIELGAGQTLWGACTSGTRLTSSDTMALAAVRLRGAGASVRNLTIESTDWIAIRVEADGTAVDDVVIRDAEVHGLMGERGSVDVRRIAIDGVRARSDTGLFGDGIAAVGAAVRVEGAVIEGAAEMGLFAFGAASTLDARDVAILETTGRGGGATESHGEGVIVGGSARATLERAVIARAMRDGLAAREGAVLEARDVVVRGTRIDALDGILGTAATAAETGVVRLERAWLEDNEATSIFVRDEGSIEARDVVITTREGVARGGPGASALRVASLVLERAFVEGAWGTGLLATQAGATLRATDVVVRGSRPSPDNGWDGAGVWAQTDCRVELSRMRIEQVFNTGIAAQVRARVTLDDVVVSGVAVSRCAETTCPELAGGFGIVVLGATVGVTDFVLEDSATCGVVVARHVDDAPELDLSRGRIARAAVGACVQEDGYDVERLRADVEYRDVGVALQATTYALPDVLPEPP